MKNSIIYSKGLKNLTLAILIMATFNLLINIPIPFVYSSINSLVIIGFSFFIFFRSIHSIKTKKISKLHLFMLLFMLVPLWGAVQAFQIHQQPLFFGILSERLKMLSVIGFFLVFLLETKWLKIEELFKATIISAGIIFGVLFFLNVFVPSTVISDFDFVINSASKGYRIKLNQTLIVFLFFYSISKASERNGTNYVILASTIVIYFFFIYKARSLTIALLICALFYFIINQKLYKTVSFTIVFIAISALLFGIGYLIFPEKIGHVISLFFSAFNVIIGGEVADASALSRSTQSEIALEGFFNHPFFGNGFLSSRWNDGHQGVYKHFYPSDIGWLGILYLYGIFGLIVFLIPFYWTIIIAFNQFKNKMHSNAPEISAAFYTMLFLFIHGFIAGYYVKKSGIILFFFSIIYYQYYKHKPNKNAVKVL